VLVWVFRWTFPTFRGGGDVWHSEYN